MHYYYYDCYSPLVYLHNVFHSLLRKITSKTNLQKLLSNYCDSFEFPRPIGKISFIFLVACLALKCRLKPSQSGSDAWFFREKFTAVIVEIFLCQPKYLQQELIL